MLWSWGHKQSDTTERLNNNFISKHHAQFFHINLGGIPEKSGKEEETFPQHFRGESFFAYHLEMKAHQLTPKTGL